MPSNEPLNPLLSKEEETRLHHPPLRPLNLPEGIVLPVKFKEYVGYPNPRRFEEIMESHRATTRTCC